MTEPNNLYSEKFKKIIGTTRDKIANYEAIKYESEQREKINAINRYRKTGSGKYMVEGTVARLKAIEFHIPENIVMEADVISYNQGYYERGNRAIEILIREGCCNINGVVIAAKNFETELKKIAINDGMNQEIDFDSLPEVIKNNIIYKNGFEVGRELIQTKKARR